MPRRTKAEALATRHRLLDAAEHLFQARGVSHTSLHDIAQAAGVTRGAVYWHFRDKVDLFNAMMERVRLPVEEPPGAVDGRRDDGALERLRTMLVATLERVARDEQVRRVFEIALHKVEYVDELAALRERHVQAIAEYVGGIERTLRRAGVPAARAVRHAHALHALVAGLIQTWMLSSAAFDLVAVGRHAIDTQLAGLTAELEAGAGAPRPADARARRRPA